MSLLKNIIGKYLGQENIAKLRKVRGNFREWKYVHQKLSKLQVGSYTLEAPSSHLLFKLKSKQPLRDKYLGIISKIAKDKYPEMSVVDVGANIGDTAAMIATYSDASLILVEASDFFYNLLLKNIKKLPNKIIATHNVFVSSGTELEGFLKHNRGTASFELEEGRDLGINCKKLDEIVDGNTKFIKIDTDGHDYEIILSSLDFLEEHKPLIHYENEVESSENMQISNQVLESLWSIGYKKFILWDDPGHLMLATDNLEVLSQLNNYLLIQSNLPSQCVFNFEILALSSSDSDIFYAILDEYNKVRS